MPHYTDNIKRLSATLVDAFHGDYSRAAQLIGCSVRSLRTWRAEGFTQPVEALTRSATNTYEQITRDMGADLAVKLGSAPDAERVFLAVADSLGTAQRVPSAHGIAAWLSPGQKRDMVARRLAALMIAEAAGVERAWSESSIPPDVITRWLGCAGHRGADVKRAREAVEAARLGDVAPARGLLRGIKSVTLRDHALQIAQRSTLKPTTQPAPESPAQVVLVEGDATPTPAPAPLADRQVHARPWSVGECAWGADGWATAWHLKDANGRRIVSLPPFSTRDAAERMCAVANGAM